jgi:hypothetical protein
MTTYSMMHVLMASPTEPLPEHKRRYQLTRMFSAMQNLEQAPEPTIDDWECINDAVVLMEALVEMGVAEDPGNTIAEAMEALGKAGYRSMQGGSIRLDAPAIGVLRGILEDYAAVLETLPARTMLTAHRKAEARVAKIIKVNHGRTGKSGSKVQQALRHVHQ